ncbi:unnamed protein product [Darwinula stevensoni]|uniref:Histone deacetylase n=1 Tax=Darwinula stevensoni TaxID=69355 RepID=A0A7R9AEQ5_9CRUS|nr:unnamed protein product [Darwinula stevensoni]CAG0902295.1 unnamed protein product [Darwinula stevensoni]
MHDFIPMSDESNIKPIMHHLYKERPPDYWPIIYCDDYNLSFCGLEKLHFFDAHRSRHVLQNLRRKGILSEDKLMCPGEPSEEDLLLVHTQEYLQSLREDRIHLLYEELKCWMHERQSANRLRLARGEATFRREQRVSIELKWIREDGKGGDGEQYAEMYVMRTYEDRGWLLFRDG